MQKSKLQLFYDLQILNSTSAKQDLYSLISRNLLTSNELLICESMFSKNVEEFNFFDCQRYYSVFKEIILKDFFKTQNLETQMRKHLVQELLKELNQIFIRLYERGLESNLLYDTCSQDDSLHYVIEDNSRTLCNQKLTGPKKLRYFIDCKKCQRKLSSKFNKENVTSFFALTPNLYIEKETFLKEILEDDLKETPLSFLEKKNNVQDLIYKYAARMYTENQRRKKEISQDKEKELTRLLKDFEQTSFLRAGTQREADTKRKQEEFVLKKIHKLYQK